MTDGIATENGGNNVAVVIIGISPLLLHNVNIKLFFHLGYPRKPAVSILILAGFRGGVPLINQNYLGTPKIQLVLG